MCSATPSLRLSQLQMEWLRPARARLLRIAGIGGATRVLDLGCGWGSTTADIAERSDVNVLGVDVSLTMVEQARANLPEQLRDRVQFLQNSPDRIDLPDRSVDIVFTQCAMMWMADVPRVLSECQRVLKPKGRLAMIEPDYGGMMEWPESIATREIWIDCLTRAGADPLMGRKLSVRLSELGWEHEVYFLDRYEAGLSEAIEFLAELETTEQQRQQLLLAQRLIAERPPAQPAHVVHLPFWMYVARNR
jgi:SAM-dependent methyltransferase